MVSAPKRSVPAVATTTGMETTARSSGSPLPNRFKAVLLAIDELALPEPILRREARLLLHQLIFDCYLVDQRF